MHTFFHYSIVFAFAIFSPVSTSADPRKPRIGFITALSGDGAVPGEEMKNAAILANSLLAKDQFELIFEDERCSAGIAVTAAKKLLEVDRIDIGMGFFCNSALLATAPLFARAKVPVISSCATTGDVQDVGPNIFRLFPADHESIQVLYPPIARDHAVIGLLAEEDAYAQLLKRHFVKTNERAEHPRQILADDFKLEETDFRSQLLRMKAAKATAIFIDSATDATFIRVVKQMNVLGYRPQIFGVYFPLSKTSMAELGPLLEGTIGAILPDSLSGTPSAEGNRLMQEYERRFGESRAGVPVVISTFEAMRLALSLWQDIHNPDEALRNPDLLARGLFGPYSFDQFGAIKGPTFLLRTVREGKVVPLA